MGRIITLSMAVLMTIGGTGVVLSETVKQTAWGGTTKAAIMQVPGGKTTATDPWVTGFYPLSGPAMGNLMLGFDLLSNSMMGDPNNPNSFMPGYDVASQNGLSPNPDITTNAFAAGVPNSTDPLVTTAVNDWSIYGLENQVINRGTPYYNAAVGSPQGFSGSTLPSIPAADLLQPAALDQSQLNVGVTK